MGFFGYLYLIEAEQLSDKSINIRTTILEGGSGTIPYFSWAPGAREDKLHAYANESIYSNTELHPLEGYPIDEIQEAGARNPIAPDSYMIEASFAPNRQGTGVVLHVTLPNRYLPRANLSPLIQPDPPFVKLIEERIILTWPNKGTIDVRFCLSPISPNDNLNDYDISKILLPDPERPVNFGMEINLGIMKFKFG
jgi:hypothetical protein